MKAKADFSGWATKAGLECADGRTIMPGAFEHQDKVKVPLVWQHGHSEVTNVLGHAILENREEGVWCEGFFNDTPAAQHAREMVGHEDINQLSIWANSLVERSKRVFHGVIREVSLVLSGANPGALIENVVLRHGDGMEDTLEDEVIIYTGLSFQHAFSGGDTQTTNKDDAEDDESLEDVFHTMNEKQQKLCLYMIAQAAAGNIEHALEDAPDESFKQIYDEMGEKEKTLLHYLIGETAEKAGVTHSDIDAGTGASGTEDTGTDGAGSEGTDDAGTGSEGNADTGTEEGADDTGNDGAADAGTDESNTDDNDDSKGSEMKHVNIFEQKEDGTMAPVLSHAEKEGILADATKYGSLKEAVEAYATANLEHGIQDIDVLFPEARALADSPELFSRRTEWVASVLAKVRKSPFARIKTVSADITVQEARAKGYITGDLKKEEFFRVAKRVTTPTTIYKKQKLDRDDMIDITDFDVVTWLKGEMRLMLDEELARAILLGDGRAVDDDDKIPEDNIRPVATDHELYTTRINVNLGDANSDIQELTDAIVGNRSKLRGSGSPTLYTTESVIAKFMLLKDGMNRRMYKSLDEVAAELRVESIVPVEVMEEYPAILAVLVNLGDYVVGADKGGSVAMFDDFDIDYNQYKYLIETRASGALVKLKSALVVMSVAGTDALVVAAAPTFDGSTITIVDTAGVTYRRSDTDAVVTSAATVPVPEGESITIEATAAAGKYFSDSDADDWTFTNEA
jgi:HK97 family phage prohead protease